MHAIAFFVPRIAASFMGIAGFVQLVNPPALRRLLAEWGYGRGFNWVSGGFTLAAAAFLAVPQLRIWGVVLAAFLLLGTTILLFDRRKYLFALPGIVLLGALPLTFVAS